MSDRKRTSLEKQLEEAKKEIAYYKRLSKEGGNTRLQEAEELSKLIASLKKAEKELENAREELERRVEQRTAELLNANLVLTREIFERMRVEEALRESEQRFRALAETTTDWIWEVNSRGLYTYSNRKVMDILGYKPEEVVEKSPFDFMPPDEAKEVSKKFLDFTLHHKPFTHLENVNLHKDGRPIILETSGVPIFDEAGKFIGYRGIDRDITERKTADDCLRKSEERFRELYDNAPVGYHEFDTDGIITSVNRTELDMTGYTLEEMVGQPVWTFIVEEEKSHQSVLDKLAGRKSPSKGFERTYRKKDGSLLPVLIEDRVIKNERGEITGVRSTIQDITFRKQMEGEIIKRRNLESIGTLAGGIAHDFNNLLMAVTGYISLARMELASESPANEFLAEAEEASLMGKDLTQRLLTFSKGGGPKKNPLIIHQVIKENARIALTGHNVRCEFSLPDDLWPILGDAIQLGQVIHNIATNARESMPPGGVIRIAASNLILEPGDTSNISPGDYVKITVEDEGMGIKAEDLPKIFDPYFTTKGMSSGSGMGLGLAVAYSIIKGHNGDIAVDSVPGNGTIVHLYLPSCRSEIQSTQKEIGAPQQALGKILFMDDERYIRDVGNKLLTRLGYEVVLAENGAEAISFYKDALQTDKPFDAVIFDLEVKGGAGGREALRALLSADPLIRAIVSSGYTDDPVISNFSLYGFKAAIAKPYKIEELKNVLHKIIQGERQ